MRTVLSSRPGNSVLHACSVPTGVHSNFIDS